LDSPEENPFRPNARALHALGVMSGLAAGAWLGAAEAPTKLVTVGLSPFLISLAMVAGVFVARWTLPTALKGTASVFTELREKAHLIIWAVLAGALWAVANTLTVFAIRDVGISIAFPLWNINSLVGVLWGWLFFRELRGAGWGQWVRVLGGAVAIVGGATLLAMVTSYRSSFPPERTASGILAALGAALLWGTMYIPYRKAYLSGMNPLSFVTVFTVGEVVTMLTLALAFSGGARSLGAEMARARPAVFWLFLGGFCWVIGDLFQQYAAKYIGIGRGIPLSNTNQLWGLAWGALVFGELAGQGGRAQALVVSGSAVMIVGAVAISSAIAPASEQASWQQAVRRECRRYGLDPEQVSRALAGEDALPARVRSRRWWDGIIVASSVAIFVWLGSSATRPPMAINFTWLVVLAVAMLALLAGGGFVLWNRTRFS